MPADDVRRFSSQISKIVEKVTQLAGSSTDPAEYAKQFIARICPTTLPYALDSEAAFAVASFNGRGLADDVMDADLASVRSVIINLDIPARVRIVSIVSRDFDFSKSNMIGT